MNVRNAAFSTSLFLGDCSQWSSYVSVAQTFLLKCFHQKIHHKFLLHLVKSLKIFLLH